MTGTGGTVGQMADFRHFFRDTRVGQSPPTILWWDNTPDRSMLRDGKRARQGGFRRKNNNGFVVLLDQHLPCFNELIIIISSKDFCLQESNALTGSVRSCQKTSLPGDDPIYLRGHFLPCLEAAVRKLISFRVTISHNCAPRLSGISSRDPSQSALWKNMVDLRCVVFVRWHVLKISIPKVKK